MHGLQAFFRWCLDEDIIGTSPMAKMKPPKVPEHPAPVLRLEAVARLIATAARTKRFEDVRDAAILRIFYSTGVRLAELATLRYLPADPEANDVDLDPAGPPRPRQGRPAAPRQHGRPLDQGARSLPPPRRRSSSSTRLSRGLPGSGLPGPRRAPRPQVEPPGAPVEGCRQRPVAHPVGGPMGK